MTIILGIDAAWTSTEPSGVAVVSGGHGSWTCHATAFSYQQFIKKAAARVPPLSTEISRERQIDRVLDAAARLVGAEPDIVAVDMPISRVSFSGRRTADRAISKEFGSRWCSAHSPNAQRPGMIGATLSQALISRGYTLATSAGNPAPPRQLIEVYPHPALLSLLQRPKRVPYKVSKSKRYWPNHSTGERIALIAHELQAIEKELRGIFTDIDLRVPLANAVPSLSALKPYEDILDALVCCWVGVQHQEGKTTPLGDDNAAIWCPSDVLTRVSAAKSPIGRLPTNV